MLRRDFLKTAAIATFPRPGGSYLKDYGWLPPFFDVEVISSFYEIFPHLENIGKGKVALLYKYIEAIFKQPLSAHIQKGPDCTSHAGGLGIDIVSAIQTVLSRNEWVKEVATEILHVGARQTIGGRKEGGVQIKELITFLKDYGYLFRAKYANPDNPDEIYNFQKYSYKNCQQLTKTGIPEWLLKKCRKHQLIKAIKVSTWNEVRDATRNLNPIVIGSDVGFDNAQRDKDGFVKPKGKWFHAWLLIATDDRYKRPGGCLISSHGDNWVKGPRRYNQPKASIWVDKDIIQQMISKYGDSYALCQINNLEPVRYKLWSD